MTDVGTAMPEHREPKTVARTHLDRTMAGLRDSLGNVTARQEVSLNALQAAIELVGDDPAPSPAPIVQAEYSQTSASASVTLAYPFEINGQRFEHVEFRPPTLADVEATMAGKMTVLQLHSLMTGVPLEAFRAMRWPDLDLVTAIAGHLAPNIRRA